jgi:hypothetical protein
MHTLTDVLLIAYPTAAAVAATIGWIKVLHQLPKK